MSEPAPPMPKARSPKRSQRALDKFPEARPHRQRPSIARIYFQEKSPSIRRNSDSFPDSSALPPKIHAAKCLRRRQQNGIRPASPGRHFAAANRSQRHRDRPNSQADRRIANARARVNQLQFVQFQLGAFLPGVPVEKNKN